MKAYIDRFEENLAVIIIEEIKKQFTKPIDQLPNGALPGTWLKVTLKDNDIMEMKIDEEETNSTKNSVDNLMAHLRSKKKESKFKK
ncbi:DUF3006 domain-containing protein [Robertmurraya massiliosenegalensis]|uniref:DUF3006 domain-containing protein n=1 Tax=Robertmurraya TaxID=2837507 RepID=UPI0039A53A63